MWLSDRRRTMLAVLALAGMAACGFAPAYGPQGGAQKLQNAVLLDDPASRDDYAFVRRFEERMGRPSVPAYVLSYAISTSEEGLGTTSDGFTTRYHLIGTADVSLRLPGAESPLHESTVRAFSGYSSTGTTVATLAAERDAHERLMTMLADKVIDRLLLIAPDLPGT